MRLSKYLSLAVAMSRNQAKFFIGKGRVSVDGDVITDPYFEVADDSKVIFDGEPIAVSNFQYILLNKPAGYSCANKASDHPLVLELIKDRSADDYYYFANVLAPEATGLVLLSDDARWTNRIKKRLLKKPRIFRINTQTAINEDQLPQIQTALAEISDHPLLNVQLEDSNTLVLKIGNVGAQNITSVFDALDLAIEIPHLQQLGRLNIGEIGEGEYQVLAEEDVKI